jgi:hypothetical protein
MSCFVHACFPCSKRMMLKSVVRFFLSCIALCSDRAVSWRAVSQTVRCINSCSAVSQSSWSDPSGQPRPCQSSYARIRISDSSAALAGASCSVRMAASRFGSVFFALLAMIALLFVDEPWMIRFRRSTSFIWGCWQKEDTNTLLSALYSFPKPHCCYLLHWP